MIANKKLFEWALLTNIKSKRNCYTNTIEMEIKK